MLQPHILLIGELDLPLVRTVSDERFQAGMPLGNDPRQIVNLALKPVSRRNQRRDRRIAISKERGNEQEDLVPDGHDRVELLPSAGMRRHEQHHQSSSDPLKLARKLVRLTSLCAGRDHTRPPITTVALCSKWFSGLGIQRPSTSTTVKLTIMAIAIRGCSGRVTRTRSSSAVLPRERTIP